MIKEAIRDRKRIKQATLKTTLPKIKNMLVQSVLNEGNDDTGQMTRQQVRDILGVQIPQEDKQRQAMTDFLQNNPGSITDQDIAQRNNHSVDRNKVQEDGKQGWNGQTPAGIIRQQASNVAIGQDENNPMPTQQTIATRMKSEKQKNESTDTIQATPQGIQRNEQQMSNEIQNVDDQTNPSPRKGQVEQKLSNAPSQTIRTSVEDNVDQREQEINQMKDKNGDKWIGQSLESLRSTNIYQEVGLQQEAGRPSVDIIEQTYTNQADIPIQGDEPTDKMQQPTAKDLDVSEWWDRDIEDRRSHSREVQGPLSQQDRQGQKRYHKDIQVESVREKDSVEPPKGKQVITQKEMNEIVTEVNKLRRSNQNK